VTRAGDRRPAGAGARGGKRPPGAGPSGGSRPAGAGPSGGRRRAPEPAGPAARTPAAGARPPRAPSGAAAEGAKPQGGRSKLTGLDVNLVVALDALLRERSVTRAAARLGLGQPAVSQKLARLREHFGDPLLVREGRRMYLSERARVLADDVSAAVAQLERVFDRPASFDPATSTRTFRLASTDNLALYLVPTLAALLAREAPHVSLRFRHLREGWADDLRRGELDAKLGRAYALPPDLNATELFRERYTCVLRRGHPAAGAGLTLRQYAALPHVLVAPGESEEGAVDRALARHGLRRHVALTVPHFLVAPFVVAATDYALTVSERVVAGLRGALPLTEVPLPLELADYALTLVWAASAEGDEGHRWLRGAIARAAAERPPPSPSPSPPTPARPGRR
jgi:DNA-binding transcriptional LysR family regulator